MRKGKSFRDSKAPEKGLANLGDDELLQLYLTLPQEVRDRRFVETARASEMIGVSRRTIQLWIETGMIRAIPIGRKYRIDLESLIEFLKSHIADRT